MRRLWAVSLCAGLVLLLHRLYDCLFNIDPATGFFDNAGDPVRFLALAAAAAAVVYCVNAAPLQSRPLSLRANIFLSALLAAGAVLTFAGSARTLLPCEGLTPAARVLTVSAGILGIPVTGWLILCAFWFVRGRKADFYTVLSFWLYPAWLCLRAVALFSRAIVNPRDSVMLAQLFCPLALAFCWLALLSALARDGKTDKAFYPTLLAGVLLCVCVGLPTALVCARAGDPTAAGFFLADALCAAAAALFAADTRPCVKGDLSDAQQ